MATLDALFRDLAKTLIADFGTTATLRSTTATYSAATGKNSETTSDVSVEISPPAPVSANRINDTTVLVGDMECLVAAKGLTGVPTLNRDTLIFGGFTWDIVGVDPIYSGDDIAAYTLRLRR